MLRDAFILSFKNLKHRGIRSWLTLLGIFIGVAAVVSLISLGNGLQTAVSSQFGISSTEVITIQAGGLSFGAPPGEGVIDPLGDRELQAIEKLSTIKTVVARYIQSGKLEYNDRAIFGYSTSIPDGDLRKFVYEQIEAETIEGRLLKDGDRKKVILGYNFFVDEVGLEKEIRPGKDILLNGENFEVIGIMEKKGSFIFDNAVLMQEQDMIDLFEIGDEIDVIGAQVKSKDLMEEAKFQIEKTLRKTRDVKEGEEDFEVSTPDSQLAGVNDILNAVTIFIAIVAGISIFIGSLGIVNTMTTSVLERRRDIGVMKSVGATNYQIFIQFFVESSLLGLVGGLVGAILGTLIGVIGTIGINEFIGGDLVPTINFILIFFTLLGSFLVGGIAGIIPAMNAAKQHPVDALRS